MLENSMRRQMLSLLLLMPLLLQLSGCGFHLRGISGNQLGQSIPAIFISGLDTEAGFGRELSRVLTANGVKIHSKASKEVPTLALGPPDLSRQVLSVDREIRAREYVLISSISYTLRSSTSKTPQTKPIKVSARRELVVDPNRILSSGQEETRLRKEMEEELAQLLLFRLRL
jgi:LPS-assembly lipoprotein